jgi:hypothetical protein
LGTWELSGYFKAPAAGTYTFTATADDYYFIEIDNVYPTINTPVVITLTQDQVVSYRVLFANTQPDLGSLVLEWKNDTSQTSFTSDFSGLVSTGVNKAVNIEVNRNTWKFGEYGTTAFPDNTLHTKNNLTLRTSGQPDAVITITYSSGSWDSVPTTFVATTGGSGSGLYVDVTVDVSGYATGVSIAVPGNGYTNGEIITATSGAASVVFTISTLPASDWIFGTDGVLTLPYPGSKIIGGPDGVHSIDMSWDLSILAGRTIKINPGASGVVSPTYWSFSSDASGGGIGLPAGSVIDDRVSGVLIGGAGQPEVNRFYTKVSDTLYQTVDEGVTYQLVNEGGTWALSVLGQDNPRYTSTNLLTWNTFVGASPAPTGELSTRATELSVGNNNTWRFSEDGSLTLPGAVVNSTVAKDGPTLPTTTGVLSSLNHNFTFSGLTDGTYGPFTLGVVTFRILVSGGTISSFVNASATGNVTVNDVLGTIDSGDLGGAPGLHTITITVQDVVQATPVALDLTKTINKLADGAYSLADGVEGQIMYLVGQTGAISTEVGVTVANYRVNGSENTGGLLLPFRVYDYSDESYYDSFSNICTLIFTDGAWQQSGGAWDQ